VIFAVALGLVGIVSVAAAVLPRSWIAKACRKDREDPQLFSSALKLVGWFAGCFYLVALIAFFAPHQWNLEPQLMLALCPLYLLRMSFDPSPVAVFFLLAPMNAALYGGVGLTVRYAWLALRRRD
jgi:hypothetical protein